MKKSTFIGTIILLFLLLIALYFLTQSQSFQKSEEIIQTSEPSSVEEIVEVDVTPVENPVEALPELNPVKNVNPFSGKYSNPFGSN